MHGIPTAANVQIPAFSPSQFEDYFFTIFLCTKQVRNPTNFVRLRRPWAPGGVDPFRWEC
jgi:hypothetical protein